MVDANSLIEGHCKFRDGKKQEEHIAQLRANNCTFVLYIDPKVSTLKSYISNFTTEVITE
ncbi:hypothetical protein Ocin01_00728 [Orchesella cincta]|uniref:Uncharacterized protein n=1 Tax=Orchesella cincta TaxID=48709 RepID=A0A1D2NL29_ORCCI|nr:hypothetical protein Ocin01_00728 [Orchesella cincta]